MLSKKDVVIAIPIYKSLFDEIEKISLMQVFKVLREYDIAFVMPENLEIKDQCINGCEYNVERFEDRYFDTTESYSELCLSPDFYERFRAYKYLLIYQLDAFVFVDRLLDFCNKGYDYWGAPAPKEFWPSSKTHIGNGGLSLRKLETMCELVNRKDEIIGLINRISSDAIRESVLSFEDKFITFGLENLDGYKMPSVEEAFEFSIEYNINGIYKDIEKHLPFGTHRWNKYNFSIWWEIIKKEGYELDEKTILECKEKETFEKKNFFNELMLALYRNDIHRLRDAYIDILESTEVSIWGYGKNSIQIINNLERCNVKVSKIYDRNRAEFISPEESVIRKDVNKIIITTTKYENEISNELVGMGKIRNRDFFTISSLRLKLYEVLRFEELGAVL